MARIRSVSMGRSQASNPARLKVSPAAGHARFAAVAGAGKTMLRKMFWAACAATLASAANAQPSSAPGPDPDKQAAALVRQMTPEERNLLLHGFFSRPNNINKLPQIGAPYAAGYTPGIARLG